MAPIEIVEFTDPSCPFAWAAEPARRLLQWRFRDGLAWRPRMVGLHASRAEMRRAGFTPEQFAATWRELGARHRMPMDPGPHELAGSLPACRAVVAVRLHRPVAERAMLRALRVLHFTGHPLDAEATLRSAARRTGLRPGDVVAWAAEPATRRELRADMDAARDPSAAARALPDKLSAQPDGGWRYTCPSYELTADPAHLSVPGFQPAAAYELAVANLAPALRRHDPPRSVREVLRFFDEPLASAEVAAVCGIDVDDARTELTRVADERPTGVDGLWTLRVSGGSRRAAPRR